MKTNEAPARWLPEPPSVMPANDHQSPYDQRNDPIERIKSSYSPAFNRWVSMAIPKEALTPGRSAWV